MENKNIENVDEVIAQEPEHKLIKDDKLDKKRYTKKVVYRNIMGTLMACPPFLNFLLFTVVPIIACLLISFTELHSYNLTLAKWVGLKNFKTIFTDSQIYFGKSIKSTLIYALTVPVNLLICLFLSAKMNKDIKGKKIWMIILFLPQVCASVASTMMWQWIFQEDFGLVNTVLYKLGFNKVLWMNEANAFSLAILVISIWQQGTNVILLLSAFANLNKQVEESARLDGANDFQIFWKITFPQLTPTLFYMLTMNLITALQEMAIFQLIAPSALTPSYRPLTVVNLIYTVAFGWTASYGIGVACALSWVVAIFIFLATKLNFALSKKWVSYD